VISVAKKSNKNSSKKSKKGNKKIVKKGMIPNAGMY